MPQTRDCDYCGQGIEPGTGTMLVHNDGSTTHFCSSKCENNADLGREARNLEWTDAGRVTTAAEQQATEAGEQEPPTAGDEESDPDDGETDADADESTDDDADEEEAEEAEA